MAIQSPTVPALLLKIKNLMPLLSRSEQAVATYISEHPEEVIYLSIAALAENSGVSDPTVVRTCQKLGFTGYQSLKVSLAQDIATPLQSVQEEVQPEDEMPRVLEKVFQSTVHALEFTHEIVNAADVQSAAELLMSARSILVFGLGGSGPVAMDIHHKLLRLGKNVRVYTDSHLQALASAFCTEEDVVFAVSHSGSSKGVVDNARLAKENGARIISLTNMGRSPLSKIADVALFTASSETKYRIVAITSRIAALTIIDAIYAYISVRSENLSSMKAEKSMEGLKY